MSEDAKKYTIIGKVEIGTDEYRELIEAAKENEMLSDRYRDKYWAEQGRVKDYEKKLGEMNAEFNQMRDFIYSDDDTYEKYNLYKSEKRKAEKEAKKNE